MPFKPRPAQKQRGSILLLTLLFLVLINLFAVAFWQLVPVEMNQAKRHLLETEAYFASDAGVTDAIAFLERRTKVGNIDNYIQDNGVADPEYPGYKVVKRTGTMNSWTWEAKIIPGPLTYGHKEFTAANPIRVYKVQAVARRPGISGNSQQYRRVSAWIKQKSFSKDGWGVNGNATNSSPLWLNFESFRLGGTYRSNDEVRVRVPGNSFWNSNEPAAIGGELLFARNSTNTTLNQVVDGVEYYSFSDQSALPYNKDNGQTIPGRYEKLVSGGKDAVRKVDKAELPPNTDSVSFGVWGGSPPTIALNDSGSFFGPGSAVNARINGAAPGGEASNGIYIEGNVSQIDFGLQYDNGNKDFGFDQNQVARERRITEDANQIIRIYQGSGSNDYVEIQHVREVDFTIPSGSTVVGDTHSPGATLSPSQNGGRGWTVVKQGNTDNYVVYQEQTNGAIYSTGNINGVRGIVHGRRTVAAQTDTGSGTAKDRRIFIDGDLTYKGTRPGETPGTTEDMLGLISYAVKIQNAQASAMPTDTNPRLGQAWPRRNTTDKTRPLWLYTSIFAGRNSDPRKHLSNAYEVGGGFGTEGFNDSNLGPGFMQLYGSINEGVRLAKGQFNSETGLGTSGMQYAFELDPGLDQVQPPFFPTLPKYDIITWEEESVFSY